MESTGWENYGTESGNPKCANCMVHSGYEATSVNDIFGSIRGIFDAAKATIFSTYPDAGALKLLQEDAAPVHSRNPLVQLQTKPSQLEETRA